MSFQVLAGCDSDPGKVVDSGGDATSATSPDQTSASEVDATPTHPSMIGTEPATFTVRPGVEIVTVLDAAAGTHLTLYDAQGTRLLTVIADGYGNAHFAYVPAEYEILDLTQAVSGDIVKRGKALPAGDGYVMRDDDQDPPRAFGPFRVLAVDDVPATTAYENQPMSGIHYGILGVGQGENVQDGLNYIRVRDGVELSAMVRLPDPAFWGDGPYPTVIEYSGYSPSNPDEPDPGSRIATLLGYATVGVNMRGTGCSGGVFDVFSPAQHADGYDIVEVVARQPWVMHHKVGMVGLSYPGISQLYVAYTNPPSLAAVTPLSVLADPWTQLRPGGIYNQGFTKQWLEERDREAAPNGQSWTDKRIATGDTKCQQHQALRNQNMEFEQLFEALEFYPNDATSRSLPLLVSHIEAPVYLTGAFQDEQTGPQFAEMLDRFDSAAVKRFVLYNGRHVDGYSPLVLTRWFEFLEIYVAQRVPRLPEFIRSLGAEEFSKEYDSTGLTFEPDRFAQFTDDQYAQMKAAYEAEPDVRVIFESGGAASQPGAPIEGFEASFATWPTSEATTRVWYLDGATTNGKLVDAAPTAAGENSYSHDPDAGAKGFFGAKGYQLMARLWDFDWTQFPAGKSLSYETEPLSDDVVLGGAGFAELWMSSDATDVDVQVTLIEVRPDGNEYMLTNGWMRVGHRVEQPEHDNRVSYTWLESDFEPLAAGEVVKTKVPIPAIGAPLRKGSRLRLIVATPGRNHGTWLFAAPPYGAALPTHELHWGGATPSSLHLSVLPTVGIPTDYPPCPGLRGQPCRPYVASENAP